MALILDGNTAGGKIAFATIDDTNDRLGIGQTSPLAMLDIKGNTTTFDGMSKIYLTDTASNAGSRNWSLGNGGSGFGNLTFAVSAAKNGNAGDATATNAMIITSSSNVGINTTTSSYKLQVNHGTTAEYASSIRNTADNLQLLLGTTTGGLLNIQGKTISSNAAYQIALQAEGGNVGIGTASPAQNLTVYNATASNFEVRSSNKFVGLNASSGYRPELWWQQGQDLGFGTATNGAGSGYDNKMIISSGGNVGIGDSTPTSYANSQKILVIEDTISPAIAWSDTGQSKDWFAVAMGSGLYFNYADGGGSSTASNVTSVLELGNTGAVAINGSGFYLKQDSSKSTIRSETQPIVLQTYGNSAWQDNVKVSNHTSEPILNVTGAGYGYTHGSIALKSDTGYDARVRGQGVYLFNEENDTTWYIGTPYLNTSAGSRPIDFNFKSSTTSLETVTAHTDNTKARIHASGVISAPSGIELGSGLDATAANTIDDYEEGTWTPTITGYSGGSTQTYASQQGNYIKIGNQIFANFYVALSNKGNIAGNYTGIGGLPFPTKTSIGGTGVINRYNNLATSVSGVALEMGGGVPSWGWLTRINGTSGTSDSYMTAANLGNSSWFMGTLIYVEQ